MAEMPSEAVNLIYIDPPFGDNAVDKQLGLYWNATEEHLRWFDEYFGQCVQNIKKRRRLAHYLYFMHERLVLMRDLLAEDGSIYVHCDWRVNNYIRSILTEIFGADRFRNEIVWRRIWAHSDANRFGNIHDTIFFYTKAETYTWNDAYMDQSEKYLKSHYSKTDEYGRHYQLISMSAKTGNKELRVINGKQYYPDGNAWKYSQATIDKLWAESKIVFTSEGTPRLIQYLDPDKGKRVQTIWNDIYPLNSQAIERLNYPTQKPEALLERTIQASSNEGDLVADFFCGSGTTLAVAAKLGRRYFGCDINPEAVSLALARLARDREQRAQMGLGI